MHKASKLTMAVAATLFAGVASAQVTLYNAEGMRGQAFTAAGPVENLAGTGFNDRASSVVVTRDRWEVCQDAKFDGR